MDFTTKALGIIVRLSQDWLIVVQVRCSPSPFFPSLQSRGLFHHLRVSFANRLYAVTKPSDREITSISYRSLEVYFRKPWTMSTDIWSWGIMVIPLSD